MKKKGAKKRKGVNKLLVALVIIAAAYLTFSFTKDQIIKSLVDYLLTRTIGAEVSMEGFNLNIPLRTLNVRGFKVYNPKGYSRSVLLELPKAELKLNLLALADGVLRFKLLDIELKELVLEKNKAGKLNVDALKIAQAEPPPLKLRIDLLNLDIGRVIYKDYQPQKPLIRVREVNLKKSYRNIKSGEQLFLLLLIEPMKHAGVQGAKIYGLSALTAGAALPVVIAMDMADDTTSHRVAVDIDTLYGITLKVMDELGEIKSSNKRGYSIHADIHGAEVTAQLKKISSQSTQINITGRTFFFPHREIAGGVLYEILEELDSG